MENQPVKIYPVNQHVDFVLSETEKITQLLKEAKDLSAEYKKRETLEEGVVYLDLAFKANLLLDRYSNLSMEHGDPKNITQKFLRFLAGKKNYFYDLNIVF